MALAVALIAVAGVIAWQMLREREPVYQGKPLSVWFRQYRFTHVEGDGGELGKQSETAIRQIGTNAIPTYLGIVSTRESALKLKLMALVPKRWLARLPMSSVYDFRFLGAYGLIGLGAEAKPAVPVLTALLKDNDPDVRETAVFTLRSLGPVASDALPSVIRCVHDPSYSVQYHAIFGLGAIHQEAERVIPILVECLDQPPTPRCSAILRHNALWSLCQFGAQAKPAVPSLLRLLNDSQASVRSDVTNALKAIDPEAAAKAGVK
jgi:hypothetical protein